MSETEVTRYAESFEGNNDDTEMGPELTYRNTETIPANDHTDADPIDTDPRLTYVTRLPRVGTVQNCTTRRVAIFGDSIPRMVAGRNRERARLRFFIDAIQADTESVFITSQATAGADSLIPVLPNAYLEFSATGAFYAQSASNANLYVIEESY